MIECSFELRMSEIHNWSRLTRKGHVNFVFVPFIISAERLFVGTTFSPIFSFSSHLFKSTATEARNFRATCYVPMFGHIQSFQIET